MPAHPSDWARGWASCLSAVQAMVAGVYADECDLEAVLDSIMEGNIWNA